MATKKNETPPLRGDMYLNLEIRKATNVDDPSGKGNVDPYCVVTCGKHKEQTDTCANTMDPVWMTSFIFGKKYPLNKGDKCEITVLDNNGLVGTTTLGTVTVDIGAVLNKPREDAWLPIQGGRGKLYIEYECLDKHPDVLFSGFLDKQGGGLGGRKSWNKRYFVLTDRNLSYYKTKEDFEKGSKPAGVILLNAYFVCDTENKDACEFMIHSYPKSLICRADSPKTMLDWMSELRAPMSHFSGLGYDED